MNFFFTGWAIFLSAFFSAQSAGDWQKVQVQSKQLEKAIDSRDVAQQAEVYVALGDSYFNQNNFSKSEEYYLKAREIYVTTKDSRNVAMVSRKLAQTQERQNKLNAAAKNYEAASSASASEYEKSVNRNDASRLQTSDISSKEKAVQQNIRANAARKNSSELSTDYENMAEINIRQKDINSATKNLENAYELTKETMPDKALEINQKAVDLLVDEQQLDKAIEKKTEVLAEEFVQQDSKAKVVQIQELAALYLKNGEGEKARQLFQSAYDLATENSHTLEARNIVLTVDSLNVSEGKSDESVVLYKDFLSKLPIMLENDSSLMTGKLFQETELRIAQLEKEKKLQDQLLKRRNLFNYLLIAALLLAIGFIIYASVARNKLKRQNKKIALQSLRREMNPHFIFNSLNSVNQFIAANNELEANRYLTNFSKLMRGVMENSSEDFISINDELDLLQNYLKLEQSRFQDKFDFEIIVDDQLKNSKLKIPGMLIQPFLENAIWHGLRYKTEKGFLKLNFEKMNGSMAVTIEDNGIGMKRSEEQKTVHQKQRNGRGMKNTLERISLLNDLYSRDIRCEVADRPAGEGTVVKLQMKI